MVPLKLQLYSRTTYNRAEINVSLPELILNNQHKNSFPYISLLLHLEVFRYIIAIMSFSGVSADQRELSPISITTNLRQETPYLAHKISFR